MPKSSPEFSVALISPGALPLALIIRPFGASAGKHKFPYHQEILFFQKIGFLGTE